MGEVEEVAVVEEEVAVVVGVAVAAFHLHRAPGTSSPPPGR